MVVKTEEVTSVPSRNEAKAEHMLVPSQVATGISTLLQLRQRKKDGKTKKTLFHDEAEALLLQFTPIKIPKTESLQLRMIVPHPVNGKNPDVCLITRDLKEGLKGHAEQTANHFRLKLEKKGITGISQVIPYRQLVDEHKPYEMKSRFASLFDVYLVEGKVFGKVTKIVGSRFFRRGKHLIPLSLSGDCKRNVEKALAKTAMTVHEKGDTYTVQVANTSFTEEQISENVFAVVSALCGQNMFPGGFDNIRSIYIKTPLSLAIPIYLTLRSADSVPMPVVAPRLPRAYKVAKGELSTFVGGEVTVYPDGGVEFRKRYTKEDRDMGYVGGMDVTDSEDEADFDDVLPGDEDLVVEAASGDDEAAASDASDNPAGPKKRKASSDEDSSDHDVEAAEDAYLSAWHKDFQKKIEEKVLPKEKVAKAKSGKQSAKSGEKLFSELQAVPDAAGGDTKKPKKQKQKLQALVVLPKLTEKVKDIGKHDGKQKKLGSKRMKLEAFSGVARGGVAENCSAADKANGVLVTNGTLLKKCKKADKLVTEAAKSSVSVEKIEARKQEVVKEKNGNLPAFAGITCELDTAEKTDGKQKKIKRNKPSAAAEPAGGVSFEVGANKKLTNKANKDKLSLINQLIVSAKKAIATPDEKHSLKFPVTKKTASVVEQSKKRKSDELLYHRSMVDETTKKDLLKLQCETKSKKLRASNPDVGCLLQKQNMKAEKKKKEMEAARQAPNDVSAVVDDVLLSKKQKKKKVKPVPGAEAAKTLKTQKPQSSASLSGASVLSPSNVNLIVTNKKKVKPMPGVEAAKVSLKQKQKAVVISPAMVTPLKSGGMCRYFNTQLNEENGVSSSEKATDETRHNIVAKKKKKAQVIAAKVLESSMDMIVKLNSNEKKHKKKDKKAKVKKTQVV